MSTNTILYMNTRNRRNINYDARANNIKSANNTKPAENTKSTKRIIFCILFIVFCIIYYNFWYNANKKISS